MLRCKRNLILFPYGSLLSQTSKKFMIPPACFFFDWIRKWKPATPIRFREEEEISDKERYLRQFGSKGVSADVHKSATLYLTAKELTTLKGIKEYFNMKKLQGMLVDQRFIAERVRILGPDLAIATFVVHRGGKVRFKGETEWVQKDEDEKYDLPKKYDVKYMVEEIDISEMHLMYDSLQNFDQLKFLKMFKAHNCPHFNDWCMDRICCLFSNTLEELDISHNKHITGKGLEVIAKLRKLKLLKLNGLEHIENIKLVTLLLEEGKPDLKIEGVTI